MIAIGRLLAKAMNTNRRSRAEVGGEQVITFDRIMALVRDNVTDLANTINQLQFMNAWFASMELARSLDFAVLSLVKLSGSDRAGADEQLASLWSVVQRLQAMAPHPSDTAVVQAGSRRIPANRNMWESERRAWITERRARGPLLLSCGPDGLKLSSGGDT